ncbi:dihydropteroate synthase [Nakamurella endophytica]|uniref:Dihydropteroate synthase n=2 Tax=Nakamurella endophytica TaxID=1748367 RepID=A0A917WGZ5_9ACTN|nr:dihydropteroate synthase [Nakamurella endophytica]
MTPAAGVPVFGARPWVMGIVNVTPDSFSDGGRWDTTERAVARGRQLVADGADLVDVGGESTRPGAQRVAVEVERDRVVPVVAALTADGIRCSVDTTRAAVAAAAVDAGAVLVNDVSGGLADPGMAALVADRGLPWVLMHWRGPSEVMGRLAVYRDVVAEVRAELLQRVEAAVAAGVDEGSLVLDPGLGFAKDGEHNWALLRRLDSLTTLGFPVLVGASRKRFLGGLLAAPDGTPRPPSGREVATAVLSADAARHGVWGVRVHEPGPSRDALAVHAALAPLPGGDPRRRVTAPLAPRDAAGHPTRPARIGGASWRIG